MRKKIFGRQLSRERDSRRALFRSLARALVINGKIETTKAKAKAVGPFINKLIKIAKKDGVVARRRVYSLLGNDRKLTDAVMKLAQELKNSGGFTRMINLPARRGDAAELVRFEWAGREVGSQEKKTKGKKESEKKQKTKDKKKAKSIKKK